MWRCKIRNALFSSKTVISFVFSQEPEVIEKAVEEMICLAIKTVEREKVEDTGAPLNAEVEIISQKKIEEESVPVLEEPEIICTPPVSPLLEKPERPSTLNFVENQNPMDMFSSLSQGSTPVRILPFKTQISLNSKQSEFKNIQYYN